jgi:SAM-dependent methyltransferase
MDKPLDTKTRLVVVPRFHFDMQATSTDRAIVLCVVVAAAVGSRVFGQSVAPGIYFAGTPQPIVEAMLNLAHVTAADVVYDLGSGDGRIPIIAAQKYGARGVGIEIQPHLVELSRQIAKEGGVADRVTFVEGDLFTADVSAATVVTLWLNDRMNARLEPKLKRELRTGARIVSHQFPIGEWKPADIVRVGNVDLFIWTVP